MNSIKSFSLPFLTGILIISHLLLTTKYSNAYLFEDQWDGEIQDPGISIKSLSSSSVMVSCPNCANDYLVHLNNSQNDIHRMNITLSYHLLLADSLHFLKKISCDGKVKPTSLNIENDIDNCKSMLNLFGSYNDTLNKDYSYLFEYCYSHEVKVKPTDKGEISFTIDNLLPHQPYSFIFKVDYANDKGKVRGDETLLNVFCMKDSAPLYPPQTDIGSFRIDINSMGNRIKQTGEYHYARSVELYWRPVPLLLAGSADLSYEIICVSEDKTIVFNTTLKDMYLGTIVLDPIFYSDISYQCNLRTKNYLGLSKDSSPIMIPKQSSIIDTHDRFNFFVAAVSNSEYLLRWTDLEKIEQDTDKVTSRRTTVTTNSSSTNCYTVYWCIVSSQAYGCAYMEGMMKTKSTRLPIVIPGDNTPKNRIFGISYRTLGNKNFTGITWSDCVAPVRSQAQSAYGPLELLKAVPSNESILINWGVKGCHSTIALIDFYDINYCAVRPVDPCIPASAARGFIDENLKFEFDNNDPNCTTLEIPNNLMSETSIRNLTASTLYAIRIRQIFGNETSNPWSKTIFAQTFTDPTKTGDCFLRQRPILFNIMLFSIMVVIIGLLYLPARKVFRHYWKLVFRYRQTNTKLPQQVENMLNKEDNLSEMGLKFWINRFPRQTGGLSHSEASLNFNEIENECTHLTNQQEAVEDDRINEEDYVQLPQPKYVAYDLNHGGEQQTLESTTESADDHLKDSFSDIEDVSITSQSSFLENLKGELSLQFANDSNNARND